MTYWNIEHNTLKTYGWMDGQMVIQRHLYVLALRCPDKNDTRMTEHYAELICYWNNKTPNFTIPYMPHHPEHACIIIPGDITGCFGLASWVVRATMSIPIMNMAVVSLHMFLSPTTCPRTSCSCTPSDHSHWMPVRELPSSACSDHCRWVSDHCIYICICIDICNDDQTWLLLIQIVSTLIL